MLRTNFHFYRRLTIHNELGILTYPCPEYNFYTEWTLKGEFGNAQPEGFFEMKNNRGIRLKKLSMDCNTSMLLSPGG